MLARYNMIRLIRARRHLFFWYGSRFTVEGKTDSRLRTVNPEPKTLIRYVVYDFRSIVNPDELLPKIEPCQEVPGLP